MTKVADLYAALGFRIDEGSAAKADKLLSGAKKSILGISAATVVAAPIAFKFLSSLAKRAAETAQKFSNLSSEVGLSGMQLQALEDAGISIGTLRSGMLKLTSSVAKAADGSKSMRLALKEAGISSKDAQGQILPLEDILGQVADQFKNTPDGIEKTTLAMQLFGTAAGPKLVPLLNKGSEGLASLTKEFEALGLGISDSDSKNLVEFSDSIEDVSKIVKGVFTQAIIAVLPALKQMQNSILVWVKANRELLQQKLVTFFKALMVIIGGVVKILWVLVRAVTFTIENFKLMTIALGSLAFAFLAMKAGSISWAAIMVANAVRVAAAWALAALPLILMATIIAAVILVGEDLYQWATGGKSVFKEMWQAFKKILADGIVALWRRAVGLVKSILGGLKDFFIGIFDAVFDKAKEIVDKITDMFVKLKEKVTGVFDTVSGGVADGLFDVFGDSGPATVATARGVPVLSLGDSISKAQRGITANITINAPDSEAAGKAAGREIDRIAREVNSATGSKR